MNYYDWQVKCLNAWISSNYMGIVNVVTGAGKTTFALSAVKHLENTAHTCELKVKILVPQTFLLSQWRDEIVRQLGARREEIGVYYGARKDTSKKYMIYVINSARYTLSKHILADFSNGHTVLLIADECHHYASEENAKAFDFYSVIPPDARYRSLGLSATPQTPGYDAIRGPLGSEIFNFGFIDALNAQIISKFALFNIAVDFTQQESGEYMELSERLTLCLMKLKKLCPNLKRLTRDSFFAHLQTLSCSNQDAEISALAISALTLSYERKSITHLAQERVSCTAKLIGQLEMQTKIIVFSERIETADSLFELLNHRFPGQAGVYHSGMEPHIRKRVLGRYRNSEIRILICCKALDEGLNVPDTDVGIVVSSSGSVRQRVQRLGRILRRSGGAKRLYYLFVEQSNEDRELLSELTDTLVGVVPMIDLRFRAEKFRYPEYEKLCANVLSHVGLAVEGTVLEELRKNLELGTVRLDWWMSENECRQRIGSATSTRERNYWTSVLYVILNRLREL